MNNIVKNKDQVFNNTLLNNDSENDQIINL